PRPRRTGIRAWRRRHRGRAMPSGRDCGTRPASRPPMRSDRNRLPNPQSHPRHYVLSRVLTRVTEYGDRREWTLNGLSSGTHRGTATIVRNKASDKLVRLNTGTELYPRRCPRHQTPKAMTTANANVNQVMAYCR